MTRRLLPEAFDVQRCDGKAGLLIWYADLTPEEAAQLHLEVREFSEKVVDVVKSIGDVMASLVPVLESFAGAIADAFPVDQKDGTS